MGSIMYTMVCTRTNVAHVISTLSIFMSNPGFEHSTTLKWLLRYLKGTSQLGLDFNTYSEEIELKSSVDANFSSDRDKRKSTTAYMFTFYGTCICCRCQLQTIIA